MVYGTNERILSDWLVPKQQDFGAFYERLAIEVVTKDEFRCRVDERKATRSYSHQSSMAVWG
jgi:hypothetical protein